MKRGLFILDNILGIPPPPPPPNIPPLEEAAKEFTGTHSDVAGDPGAAPQEARVQLLP